MEKIIIARVCDNSRKDLQDFYEKGVASENGLQLQGFKNTFNYNNIVSLEPHNEFKNAFMFEYRGVLENVKISQLKNYSKIDFAKFIDNEINEFSAQLDDMPVLVTRNNGATKIISYVQLLIYYA